MALRPLLLFATLAVVLLVPATARAADVVEPSSVSGSANVPAGGARTLALECPSSAVALNAAVTRQGPGITVRASVPGTDAGSWRFRVSNAAGGARRIAAVLRCVRLEVPNVSGVRLLVHTRNSPRLTVPVNGTVDFEANCARGSAPAGYGLAPGARGSDVRLAGAVATARGWQFTLENTGDRRARTVVHVRCLKRVARGTRAGTRVSLRFSLTHPTFRDTVGPGSRSFSNACPRRTFAVANGISLDPADDIVLTSSHPAADRAGIWRFRQGSGTQQVGSSLVCLGRGARFR